MPSVLSFLRDDRVLFAGLGVAVIALAGFMLPLAASLHAEKIKNVEPEPPRAQFITQVTEDRLSTSTLESLLTHYNFAIRDTALKIVAGRAAHDADTIHHLLRGIIRPDYHERSTCLRALAFIMDDKAEFSTDPLDSIDNAAGHAALVQSLAQGLGDRERESLSDPLYDDFHLRDICERRCLMLLSQLARRSGVDRLLEAQFVEKWLSKQDWGDSIEERQANFIQYVQYKKGRIADICARLRNHRGGRKALRVTKLLAQTKGRKTRRGGAGRNAELVPRVVEQSAEEQRRRRRHREAIVMNDGTHSLGRDDIIEREH